ncbi:hypothetical protein CSC94_07625 [Zhengella mangrovi]|uniref:Fungal lipase-type domain-containing protein n=1 Tax=Zhengella mangrovi TaxID=1982044 RepID=A0A2G1QPZ9_9HYPH|nr:hypothetical protein [Zhengella mangrovi]PHP67565.1 hypothetical protein CSC94_07625 [Zhengella mangrovi]
MRRIGILFAIGFLSLLQTVSGALAADVYVMRGLMGFLFPDVMYPLATAIRQRGHHVEMTSYQAADRIAQEILEKKRKNPNLKVAVVGHSLGGNAVTTVAQKLANKGVWIDYAAVVDAPHPGIVAPSVRVVDNFYQFQSPRSPVLVARNPQKTRLTQYNFRKEEQGTDGVKTVRKPARGHFTIATDPFVTDRIITMIDCLGK